MLHDIGKIGRARTRSWRKPGRLTEEELLVIRRHPELGVQILEHPSLGDVRTWVGAHHERPDGLGYPLGISGDEVPLEARIVAVADAYEAMTSDRSYRDSIGHSSAQAELRRCAAQPVRSTRGRGLSSRDAQAREQKTEHRRCLPAASTAERRALVACRGRQRFEYGRAALL